MLREGVKHIYNVVRRENGPALQQQQLGQDRPLDPGPANIQPQEDGDEPEYAPIYVTGEGAGVAEDEFLLGGVLGFVRKKLDHRSQLDQVKALNKPDDQERGKHLCLNLIRCEFAPDVLATHNLTGRSRNMETRKSIAYPKLNEHVLKTIFKQVKMQFPGFNDNYQDHRSSTGQAIQSACKKARQQAKQQAQACDDEGEEDPAEEQQDQHQVAQQGVAEAAVP